MDESSAMIIVDTDGHNGQYSMFDLRQLDPKGAVLAGPLLMEVGESFRLKVHRGGKDLELRAKVSSISEDKEQMTVHFVDLNSQTKAILAKK